MSINMYATKSVNVIQLVLIEEMGIVSQWVRPYVSEIDQSVIASVNEVMDQNPAKLIPAAIAAAAGAFVRPNMDSGGMAQIPNGWGTSRFRFVLHVVCTNAMGTQVMEVITGYTDYSDMSFGGNIDPNVKFNINNISTGLYSEVQPSTRAVNQGVVAKVTNVLKLPDNATAVPGQYFIQRPMDVFSSGEESTVVQGGYGVNHAIFHPLGAATEVSKAIHNTSTRFVYDMLDASVNSAMIDEDSPEKVNANLEYRLKPDGLTKDLFISKLIAVTGDYMRSSTSTFTMNELCMLDPDVWGKYTIVPADGHIVPTNPYLDATETGRMAQVATIYGQSLPAYMTANGIQSLEMFQAPGAKVQLRNVRSIYQGRPMMQLYQSLISALETELYVAASFGGQLPFTVMVSSSIYGFTDVNITDEFGRDHNYRFPSYADSTYAPVVSNDQNQYVRLSADMHTLVTQVRSNAVVHSHY